MPETEIDEFNLEIVVRIRDTPIRASVGHVSPNKNLSKS
jgi:hypothetical protein